MDPLSGVLLCGLWGGKEWIKPLAKGCGGFACADNGSELGRVESCPWVEEIRGGSWLFPGGHAAALELRITAEMFSHGSAGPPGVQEAEAGSPTRCPVPSCSRTMPTLVGNVINVTSCPPISPRYHHPLDFLEDAQFFSAVSWEFWDAFLPNSMFALLRTIVLWAPPPALVLILGIGGNSHRGQELRAQLSEAERDFGEELQGFFEFQGCVCPYFNAERNTQPVMLRVLLNKSIF